MEHLRNRVIETVFGMFMLCFLVEAALIHAEGNVLAFAVLYQHRQGILKLVGFLEMALIRWQF